MPDIKAAEEGRWHVYSTGSSAHPSAFIETIGIKKVIELRKIYGSESFNSTSGFEFHSGYSYFNEEWCNGSRGRW